MEQRVVLLTGATDGLGRALAGALAQQGFHLLIHGRNADRLQATRDALRHESGNPKVDILQADLSRLQEVRRMGIELHALVDHLDILIANAGVFMTERQLTEDGHECSFQINHLAHLQMILDAMDLMKLGGRILQVASTSHEKLKQIDLDNLDWHSEFSGYFAYALSKAGQVAAAMELAPHLRSKGITINALHPGSILTKLQIAGWGGDGHPDPTDAVNRILQLALDPPFKNQSGLWFVNNEPRTPNTLLMDEHLRRGLWERSLAMIGAEEA